MVDRWLCIPKHSLRNRNGTISGFLLKRLFMLSRHFRQYTPSCFPNPSLGSGVLDNLIHPCIDVGSVSTFPIHGFFLDSFMLFRHLIDKLMIWMRSLAFMLLYNLSLCNLSLFFIALCASQFRLRLLGEKRKR